MAEAPDIAEHDAGILEHLRLGVEDVGRGLARLRRCDAGLGREPQQILDALGRLGRLADRDVAVEIAEIARVFRAGVDQQDVTVLEATAGRSRMMLV